MTPTGRRFAGASDVTLAAPSVQLVQGEAWISHREAAALQGEHASGCDGTLRIANVCGPDLAEVACDGCSFVLGVRPAAIARAVETRPPRWWDR